MSKKIKDEYRILEDYLPLGYNIEYDSYISEENDMIFEISLYDNDGEIIEYLYCDAASFESSIHDIMDYSWKDYRDKKINNLLDGTN